MISNKSVTKILLATALSAFLLTLTAAKCPGKSEHCKQETSNSLSRYNLFVQLIPKHRRSAASRHETNDNNGRSTYRTQLIHQRTIQQHLPPARVALPTSVKPPSTYTNIQQNPAIEELRRKQIRLIQERKRNIYKFLRRNIKEPWWGTWSTWSACGRTCGSGVQFQKRNCLGQKWISTLEIACDGPSKRYKICNTGACPLNTPSFRKLQCFQNAASKIRGRLYSWKPYGHPVEEVLSSEPCQLVCVSDIDEVQISAVAMDGTECHREWDNGRCVDGKCQLIGCDGKINSEKLRNKCGKCDGDATSCVVHDRMFSQDLSFAGEHEIVRIPNGAYDILINERRKTSATILVRDANDTILFNGGGESGSGRGADGWPSNVVIAGGEFRYRKPILTASTIGFEYLVSSGPINSDIVILLNATKPGSSLLHYEFKIPVAKHQENVTDNVTAPEIYLTDDEDVLIPNITVSTLSSTGINDVSTLRDNATTLPEDPTGEENSFVPNFPVSSTGVKNVSTPRVIMFAEKQPDDDTDHLLSIPPVLEFEYMNNDETPKENEEEGFLVIRELDVPPIEEVKSNKTTNSSNYDISAITEPKKVVFVKPQFNIQIEDEELPNNFFRMTDNETDIETIARFYVIEKELGGEEGNGTDGEIDNDVVSDDDDKQDPDYGEDYVLAPGVNIPVPVRYGTRYRPQYIPREMADYRWRTKGFAPCSSTCRSGLQDSYAVCERKSDHITVSDDYCNPAARPEPVRKSCARQKCEPRWEATPWSDCSLSCGIGVQMRTVRCWLMIGAGFDSTLYTEICIDVVGEKPIETKPCKIVDHCGPLWETSDWSACSAPCGRFGIKWRTVRCSAGQHHFCNQVQQPNTKERCTGPKCLLHWIVTDWGPCSGVCGGGRKVRTVLCSDDKGRARPDHACDLNLKPATSHPCGDVNCRPEWITQDWEECSVECGIGVRKRQVICSGIVNGEVHNYEDDTPCSGQVKPSVQETCKKADCDPVWFTTPWSKCSVTCGSGNRVRKVKCYLKSVPATGCVESEKPPTGEKCDMAPCPTPRSVQCKNKATVNCDLVIKLRLCTHWYYRKACCGSCEGRRPPPPRGK